MHYLTLCFLLCFCNLNAHLLEERLTATKKPLTIGLISAIPEELGSLLQQMESVVENAWPSRTFYKGTLDGIDTVIVSARVGKVASAATVAHLIATYPVDLIIFTGVAGALDPLLNIGDIVIAEALTQYDLDCRPFRSPFEIPLLRISACPTDPLLVQMAFEASSKFVEKQLPLPIREEFAIVHPRVMKGLVITGDQVIFQESQKTDLKEKLPQALCVEMEGASIAQVCYEYGIPCVVIRTISDSSNHANVHYDIRKFITSASGYYSSAIIKDIYAKLKLVKVAVIHPWEMTKRELLR